MRAVRLDPLTSAMPSAHHTNISGKLTRAQRLIQDRRLTEAEQVLLPLTRRFRRAEAPWVLLASVYGQLGRYQDAERCCREIIAINPHHAMGLSLLGSACVTLGKHEEAIAHLSKAAQAAPKDPGIRNNLGNALYAQGKADEAEHEFRAALRFHPGHAQAHFGLGNCQLAQGLWHEALGSYRSAYHAMADNYDINMSLGLAYQNLGGLDEAIGCFRRALELTDRTAEPFCALAYVTALQGHLDEALDYLEQVLRDHPENPRARVERADIYHKMGRIGEAHDQICALLAEGLMTPRLVTVYAFLCQWFQECDKVIALAEDLLAHHPLKRSEYITLQYLLGKLYDQAGDYEAAFRHVEQANTTRPSHFDRAAHTRGVDRLIQAYSRTAVPALPQSDCRDARPVFIVGMPRSGTSLVEQILASHPRVYGAGERTDIEELVARLSRTEMFDYVERLETLDQKALTAMASDYLARISDLAGNAERLTDKMPANFLNLGLIAQLFPAARIIHCRRDPRDTCLSVYFQQFSRAHTYSNDLSALAHFYREYERLMAHWQAVLDLPVLEVDYAQLVSRLEDNARRMVRFLDLEWDANCLEFHKSGRVTATASFDQVREPIYTRSSGRWKHYREHLGPLVTEFGDQEAPLAAAHAGASRQIQA